MKSEITAFEWIKCFLDDANAQGIPIVYLRNHEKLPHDIGNDVDLLISPETLELSIELLLRYAIKHSWLHIKTIEFGPCSLFFCKTDGSEFVHIDLFISIDYHWLPYGNAQKIIERRQWNGLVFIPNPLDEVFLNLTTRLFYHGIIREKHRQQTRLILNDQDAKQFINQVRQHVGIKLSQIIVTRILAQEWDKLETEFKGLRRLLLWYALTKKTGATFCAFFRYIRRSLKRIISPPGPFIVFEGADGVGKSTLIEKLFPICKGLTGRSDTLLFHWKPALHSRRLLGEPVGAPRNPRGNKPRSVPISLLFLAYHWIGFWLGYFRYLFPVRLKNRAVIGDRYAYEFFLDPKRLRLDLPEWILIFAAITTPQPNLVICMTADPKLIIQRKPELSESEIIEYQLRLRDLLEENKKYVELSAEDNPTIVLSKATNLIISSISN